MSSKVRALGCQILLFLLLLHLLFFTAPSSAARQLPAFPDATPAPLKNLHGDLEVEKVQVQVQVPVQDDQVVEESCDGVGEEECLMRRTLAAHLDYIYTQKSQP